MVLPWAPLTCVAVGLVVASARLDGGGWAVVTVKDLPDYVVAGEPVVLTYAVRGHGRQLVDGLRGWIQAAGPENSSVIKTVAAATGDSGYYAATLTLPTAGQWTLDIRTGLPMMIGSSIPIPVRVVGSRDEAPRVTAAERGERLFLAKGCVTCHGEGGVGAGPFGPSLKGRWLAPEYVKLFLRDPSIRPPSQPGWEMPNLHLSEVEVDALAAFLNPKLTKTQTASLP